MYSARQKLHELAKRCGRDPKDLPTIFQNPHIVTLVFDYLKEKDSEEMPALLFDWNDAGFNDTAVPNCRNGIEGQTKASIIANLLANGATNYRNQDILFIFPNGLTIGDWYWNLVTNLPWAKHQNGIPDICNHFLRINKISAHTGNTDIENSLSVLY
ncbi:14455_t:CDS:2 [Cetraspora pellucida]|uniref:14455_t:CDS:1 n=1 Tax=Cetraspora pellucida TaxID=1433469 RepID=A0A9N9A3D3_9GLOM|nr:14455_t:CDS:2 [Cetraspora pellucida]